MILNMCVIYVHLLLTLELAHASEAMFTWRGVGLGWAVNVCWELRTDLKLFQAVGTLPWCLQAHQNIKLLEVQAITRP